MTKHLFYNVVRVTAHHINLQLLVAKLQHVAVVSFVSNDRSHSSTVLLEWLESCLHCIFKKTARRCFRHVWRHR